MARVASDDDYGGDTSSYESIVLGDVSSFDADRSGGHGVMSTLDQLLKNSGDLKEETVGDKTLVHRVPVLGSPNTPSVQFVLSFNNLTYRVKLHRKLEFSNLLPWQRTSASAERQFFPKTKTLLDNISGETRNGEILAILGASGSGKSTLIDALANRIAKQSLKGSVTLNGEVLQSRLLKVISAYVMQDDLLFPMLTVKETLMFAAEFRLPRSLPNSKKKLRVEALIDQLGIRNAAETIIGDEGHRGISGGERRRVSIGIDVIHDPILLLLDEPTSGLDSTSAFTVVKVLKRIAQSGSIVIMSIHQPSHRILGLLDRLIFLSRSQTVFSGSPTNLPQFFAEFGHPIPENENRTEFALDLIRELEESADGTKELVEFSNKWQGMKTQPTPPIMQCHLGLTLREAISASISRGKLVSDSFTIYGGGSSMVSNFANPFWVEIWVLIKRFMLNSWRQPELFGIRLSTVVVTGFILATVYWQLDISPKGVQERLSFFAFAVATIFYICAEAIPIFLQERYIFLRETAYNAYRISSYVISHTLTSLPSLFFLSIVFATITFWAIGLDGGTNGFLFYCLIIFASFWSGNSFATFLSGFVRHVTIGYTIVTAILAYFLLFSGFLINRDRIPSYWIWFHYISLMKYPYEAVMHSEFEDPTKCLVRGTQIFDNTLLGAVPYAMKVRLLETMSGTLGVRITSETCVTLGADTLRQQGATQLGKWNCLWVTLAWGLLFRVLFYFSLLLGGKNRRR